MTLPKHIQTKGRDGDFTFYGEVPRKLLLLGRESRAIHVAQIPSVIQNPPRASGVTSQKLECLCSTAAKRLRKVYKKGLQIVHVYLCRGKQAVVKCIPNIHFLHITRSNENDLQNGPPIHKQHMMSSLLLLTRRFKHVRNKLQKWHEASKPPKEKAIDVHVHAHNDLIIQIMVNKHITCM